MISLLYAALLVGGLPHPLRPLEPGIDVRSYSADITVNVPSTKRIDVGVNRIVLQRMSPADTVFSFHLRTLDIDSVIINGMRTDVRTVGTEADTTYCHQVLFRPALVPTIDTVTVHYHGLMSAEPGSVPWGGVQFDDDVLYAMGVGFNNAWVSATQHWLPVLDHPGDKASFHARFTVPAGLTAASNGLLVGDPVTANGMTTFEWDMPEPCATYLLTFAIGRFAELNLAPFDTLPHVAFVQARDTANARVSMRLVPRMQQMLARWFGTYPFGKVGYVSTVKGAMEHQSMISINTSLVQRRDTVNSVAAHELAHQWFGDLVTPVDYRHVWLTESFATYCESLWTEELFGTSAYLTSLDQRRQRYFNVIATREGVMPLYDFPRASPSSNYPETIYQKGAAILGMMRAWMGDSVFGMAMRTYLDAYRYGNATTDELRQIMEDASGHDLTTFFDQWMLSAGWPKLSVTLQRNDGSWTAIITQVQQQQKPSWPLYEIVPLAMTYREAGTLRNVDTILVIGSTPYRLSIDDPSSFRINTGMKGRSLVEVTTITSAADDPAASISIAPNPVQHDATLTRTIADSDVMVRIVDQVGHQTLQRTWHRGDHRLTLDLRELPSGAYFVQVGVMSMPLVIER